MAVPAVVTRRGVSTSCSEGFVFYKGHRRNRLKPHSTAYRYRQKGESALSTTWCSCCVQTKRLTPSWWQKASKKFTPWHFLDRNLLAGFCGYQRRSILHWEGLLWWCSKNSRNPEMCWSWILTDSWPAGDKSVSWTNGGKEQDIAEGAARQGQRCERQNRRKWQAQATPRAGKKKLGNNRSGPSLSHGFEPLYWWSLVAE